VTATDYDPVTAEVISMAMQSIVLEMGITIERTSGSPAATDAKDYSCVITRADGGAIAYYGNNLQHLGDSLTGTQALIKRFDAADINDGDVFIYNDPFECGALHQADLAIQMPVYFDSELVAWMFCNIHLLDIGGMSSSGFAPESRDVFGEGLRITPLKIVDAGQPVPAIWELIRSNVRMELVLGDVRSMIAANHVGRTRLLEVVEEHGAETFDHYIGVNEKLVADLLADRIGKVPPGVYHSSDWVEYDAFGGEEYVPVSCQLEVTNDARLIFDFSESGPQVPGYCNASRGAMLGSVMPVILAALLPDFPVNAGAYGRFEINTGEPGKITNPVPPAGVSGGHMETGPRALRAAHSALIAAMAVSEDEWIRERAYALGGITVGVIVLTGFMADGSRGYAFMLDQQATGHGALPVGDGVSFGGIDYSIAGRQPDVESAEIWGPILYLWRREVTDSGGAGAYRGGSSLETAFVPHNVVAAEISHACAGGVIPTPGSCGGYPGGTTYTEVYPDVLPAQLDRLPDPGSLPDAHSTIAGKTALVEIELRDAVRQVIAAGSGWGDPLLRAVTAVSADVADEVVSAEAAAAVYGVVTTAEGEVDTQATTRRREEIRRDRLGGSDPAPIADPSPRQALERVGTDLRCGFCETALGNLSDWTSGSLQVRSNRHELAERLGSWNTPIVAARAHRFELVEHVCPTCATLIDVEVELVGKA
jgi:N-methylhydantoinase B